MDPEAAAEELPFAFSSGLLPCGSLGRAASGTPLVTGLTLSPLRPLAEPSVLRREPLRCARCEGIVGPHCAVDAVRGAWACGVCGGENRSLTLAADPAELAALPELREPVVEYVVPRRAPGGGAAGAVLFLVDDSAGDGALRDLIAAVRASLALLPPNTRVGLLGFGRAVSLYLLAQGEAAASSGVVEALVLGAPAARSRTEQNVLATKAPLALAPRSACEHQLVRALQALQPASAAAASGGRQRPAPRGHALLEAVDTALELLAVQ